MACHLSIKQKYMFCLMGIEVSFAFIHLYIIFLCQQWGHIGIYEVPYTLSYRNPALEYNLNGQLQQQRSGLLGNGRFSRRSSSGSLDSVTDSGAPLAEFHNGIKETESDGPRMPVETNNVVNNNDSPKTKTRLEIVNNRESFKVEAQLKLVNSDKESLKMENRFKDEGVEFD